MFCYTAPDWSVVSCNFFFVTPIVGVCNCSMFCCMLLYVHSSIAIILMGKRELVALLNLSFWRLVLVERLFLAVPLGCLRFVIVVFSWSYSLTIFVNFFTWFHLEAGSIFALAFADKMTKKLNCNQETTGTQVFLCPQTVCPPPPPPHHNLNSHFRG